MEVIKAKSAGFCFGVKKAMETVYQQIEENANKPIYTFGPLIHNEEVVKELHRITFVGSSVDFKGVYRTDFVTIPHARNMPPVRHISYFMNKLFDEYKEMAHYDILKKVAVFHIKFENIHPFDDGNGRIGRFEQSGLCVDDVSRETTQQKHSAQRR